MSSDLSQQVILSIWINCFMIVSTLLIFRMEVPVYKTVKPKNGIPQKMIIKKEVSLINV